jgi:hypothetical protein
MTRCYSVSYRYATDGGPAMRRIGREPVCCLRSGWPLGAASPVLVVKGL